MATSGKPTRGIPTGGMPTSGIPTARARRSRKPLVVIIVVLGLLGALVTAAVLIDGAVRGIAEDIAADKARKVLRLGPEHPVDVHVGGFPVLTQVISGRLDEVTIQVEDVEVGQLRGDVELLALGMPTDRTQAVERVQVELSVPESTVQELTELLGASALTEVRLGHDEIIVSGELQTPRVELFGMQVPSITIPLAIGLEPHAEGGNIGFTPTSVEVDGAITPVEELRARYGRLVEPILQTRWLCVATELPSILQLDGAEVQDGRLVVNVRADDQVFTDEALATRGTCE